MWDVPGFAQQVTYVNVIPSQLLVLTTPSATKLTSEKLVHMYNTQEALQEAINPLGPIALIRVKRLSAS